MQKQINRIECAIERWKKIDGILRGNFIVLWSFDERQMNFIVECMSIDRILSA